MRRFALPLLILAGLMIPAAVPAHAAEQMRTIHFRGETVRAPASWPVIRLSERPRTCVRMDRRAVYLGTPSSEQRCPSGAVGRQRAILVAPGAEGSAARASATPKRVRLAGGSEFTGLGFDACTAPSSQAMAAWAKSPFRAVGVYIGGSNRACSQPNLTASWVAEQIAAGWHLIPTYVGLQATTSSCTSCATLSPTSATLQGTAAANDAVEDARAIGLGPGSPIYYDMESYTRTASATSSTLAFLGAWTSRLHALGYDSGVYSSSASGIRDLVSRIGTPYPLPDDLWIANWNGRQDTVDPYVPSYAWADHQRIHQYRGGHNETWGGVTINIDSNYVEGATAGISTGSPDDPVGRLEAVESPLAGQVRVVGWAYDPNAPRRSAEIRVQISGRDAGGARRYHLGPVASQPHSQVLPLEPRASGGFDSTFPIVGSGRQRVCVHATNIGRGADKLLGCQAVGVRVPITLSNLRTRPNSARVRVRCEWPQGTQCPGQLMLRTKVAVRVGAGRRARTKLVTRAIGRRAFRLTGGRSHAFWVPLSASGRRHVKGRTVLHADLVVAVPGSRLAHRVKLR